MLNHFSNRNMKLQPVSNLKSLINENARTTEDLYNSAGAILVHKGSVPPPRLFKMPVYIYVKQQAKKRTRANVVYITDLPLPKILLLRFQAVLVRQESQTFVFEQPRRGS